MHTSYDRQQWHLVCWSFESPEFNLGNKNQAILKSDDSNQIYFFMR